MLGSDSGRRSFSTSRSYSRLNVIGTESAKATKTRKTILSTVSHFSTGISNNLTSSNNREVVTRIITNFATTEEGPAIACIRTVQTATEPETRTKIDSEGISVIKIPIRDIEIISTIGINIITKETRTWQWCKE